MIGAFLIFVQSIVPASDITSVPFTEYLDIFYGPQFVTQFPVQLQFVPPPPDIVTFNNLTLEDDDPFVIVAAILPPVPQLVTLTLQDFTLEGRGWFLIFYQSIVPASDITSVPPTEYLDIS